MSMYRCSLSKMTTLCQSICLSKMTTLCQWTLRCFEHCVVWVKWLHCVNLYVWVKWLHCVNAHCIVLSKMTTLCQCTLLCFENFLQFDFHRCLVTLLFDRFKFSMHFNKKHHIYIYIPIHLHIQTNTEHEMCAYIFFVHSLGTVFCILIYKYEYYWAICIITTAQYSPQCITMQNTETTHCFFENTGIIYLLNEPELSIDERSSEP